MVQGRHKNDCTCPKCTNKKEVQEYEKETEKELSNFNQKYVDLKKTLTNENNLDEEIKKKIKVAYLDGNTKDYMELLDESRLYDMYSFQNNPSTPKDKLFDDKESKILLDQIRKRKLEDEFKNILYLELSNDVDEKQEIPETEENIEMKKEIESYIESEIDEKIEKDKEEVLQDSTDKYEAWSEKAYEEYPELADEYKKEYSPKKLGRIFAELQSDFVNLITSMEYNNKEKTSLSTAWQFVINYYMLKWELFLKYFPILLFIAIQIQVNLALFKRFKKEKEEQKKRDLVKLESDENETGNDKENG